MWDFNFSEVRQEYTCSKIIWITTVWNSLNITYIFAPEINRLLVLKSIAVLAEQSYTEVQMRSNFAQS